MAIHADLRAYSQYGELRFSNKVIHTNQFKLNRIRSTGHPPSTVSFLSPLAVLLPQHPALSNDLLTSDKLLLPRPTFGARRGR